MFSRALIGSLVATIASVPRRGCPDPAGRARVSGCRARRSGACQRGCRPPDWKPGGSRCVRTNDPLAFVLRGSDRSLPFLVLYDMRGSFRGIALSPPGNAVSTDHRLLCALRASASPSPARRSPTSRLRFRLRAESDPVPRRGGLLIKIMLFLFARGSVEPLRSASAEAGVVRACVRPEGTPTVRHSRPRRA